MSVFYIRDFEQTKEQIAKLTQSELFTFNIRNMRKCLFKYYSFRKDSRNYSIEALKNNTVYLSSPREFDDPYDCNIYIDNKEFALKRISYYASLCGIETRQKMNYADIVQSIAMRIYEHIRLGNKIETLFELNDDNPLVKAHQEYFLLYIEKELLRKDADGNSYYDAINHVINKEYIDMQSTANRFRIACFAQTPYSMLMWSHYAYNHQGFCIEYEMPNLTEENEPIYSSLFPVIYSDTRTDLSQISLKWKSTGSLSDNDLWDFYKYGLLSKSIDWRYQQEWRLISCDNLLTDDEYNCKFFNIKKVYLGNNMSVKDRLEIIDICKSKNISYTGVAIDQDRFNMKDCSILCENCDRINLEEKL